MQGLARPTHKMNGKYHEMNSKYHAMNKEILQWDLHSIIRHLAQCEILCNAIASRHLNIYEKILQVL